MQNQKSLFLQIVSILALLFGTLCVAALVMLYMHYIKESDLVMAMGLIMSVVAVAAGITAGVHGIVNCRRADKMYNCMSWGVAWLVLHVFGQYIALGAALSESPNLVASAIGVIGGSILPVLFIIAASNFKKRAAREAA